MAIKNALKSNSKEASLYFENGRIYEKLGLSEKAIKAYENAAKYDDAKLK